MVAFFVVVPDYDIELFRHKKSKCDPEVSLKILRETLPILEALVIWDNDNLFQSLKNFGKEFGYKTGTVMWPVRTALSGIPATPGGATALAEVLGKDETLQRIRAGIKKLEASLT